MWFRDINNGELSPRSHFDDDNEGADNYEAKTSGDSNIANGNHCGKQPIFQRGVLRTNCIDCLDRTNVAQYAYGLAALGHQLYALGVIENPKIDLDAPLAEDLMGFYERMGDTLAHQYGGSAAHNKVPVTSYVLCMCSLLFNMNRYLKVFNKFCLLFTISYKVSDVDYFHVKFPFLWSWCGLYSNGFDYIANVK